jgi:hypothetical protein
VIVVLTQHAARFLSRGSFLISSFFPVSLARAASTAFLSHHVIRLLVGLGRRSQTSSGVRFVGGRAAFGLSWPATKLTMEFLAERLRMRGSRHHLVAGAAACSYGRQRVRIHVLAARRHPRRAAGWIPTWTPSAHPAGRLRLSLGWKMKMIISDFRKSFSSFFRFLGLNENGSGNRKNENDNDKNNRKRKRK